jgi:hypothetical protein
VGALATPVVTAPTVELGERERERESVKKKILDDWDNLK